MSRFWDKPYWLTVFVMILFFGAGTSALAAPPAQEPTDPEFGAAHHAGNVGYVLAWRLNLRAGPSLDYEVVAVAGYWEPVTLLERTTDSMRVKVRRSNGQAGWTLTRYIEASPRSIANLPVFNGGQPTPTKPTATVQTPSLNVRGGPGLNFDILDRLSYGQTARLIGRNADGSWLKIAYSGSNPTFAEPTGWVLARYVWSSVQVWTLPVVEGGSPPPPTDQLVGLVTVPRLNVRSGPGLSYAIVSWVGRGQQVQIFGRTPDSQWLKVAVGPQIKGWVYAPYVSIVGPYSSLPVTQ